jgi:hypothetical protein
LPTLIKNLTNIILEEFEILAIFMVLTIMNNEIYINEPQILIGHPSKLNHE